MPVGKISKVRQVAAQLAPRVRGGGSRESNDRIVVRALDVRG